MAITENNESEIIENKSIDEMVEEAADYIKEERYQDAYNYLAVEMEETKANITEDNYRDEKIVANILEPEITDLLSEVITGEPYRTAGSLEQSEIKLKEFAAEYTATK